MISRNTLSLAITVIRLSMGSFTKTVFPSEDKEMPLAPMKLEKSVKNTENGDKNQAVHRDIFEYGQFVAERLSCGISCSLKNAEG